MRHLEMKQHLYFGRPSNLYILHFIAIGSNNKLYKNMLLINQFIHSRDVPNDQMLR